MTTVADGWAVDKKYTSAEGECHRTENQKRDKLKVAAGHPANMRGKPATPPKKNRNYFKNKIRLVDFFDETSIFCIK